MKGIELRDLRKYYGKGERTVKALDGINITINQGEFVAIVGRSGSGKTTTLDCMGLLMRPTTGSVLIDDVDTSTLNDNRRAELRGNRIGFIFQDFNLLPTMTAMDNILLPLRYTGGDRKAARKRADELLEEVDLVGRGHHRPGELSGGEKQRVAIARALINEPTMVLGDEPTGEVDSETAAKLLAVLRRMNSEHGVTFVLVTHDLELASKTDRVIRLSDGHVVSDEKVVAGSLPGPVAVG